MKASIEQIKRTIKENMKLLEGTYKVKSIGVFGSAARGDNISTSDVDILVEFSEPIGFFKFIELEEFLSKIIGRKVDLVTKKALKPIISREILEEVIYV